MIEIENISKHFDDTVALSQVSFRIPEGKVFGLLGTNGAGKSTLLRVMAGILKADAGTVRIDGEDAYENPEMCIRDRSKSGYQACQQHHAGWQEGRSPEDCIRSI